MINKSMTRVNILLPLFETSLRTNNSEVIAEIVKERYGLNAAHIFWLEQSQ